MRGRLGDRQRLQHMLSSIAEIESYTSDVSFEVFVENSMMRFATIKQLEIIGEAANLITEESRTSLPDIPWRQIIGLRHILVHEYLGIDDVLVWQVLEKDLPFLKENITSLLALWEE